MLLFDTFAIWIHVQICDLQHAFRSGCRSNGNFLHNDILHDKRSQRDMLHCTVWDSHVRGWGGRTARSLLTNVWFFSNMFDATVFSFITVPRPPQKSALNIIVFRIQMSAVWEALWPGFNSGGKYKKNNTWQYSLSYSDLLHVLGPDGHLLLWYRRINYLSWNGYMRRNVQLFTVLPFIS